MQIKLHPKKYAQKSAFFMLCNANVRHLYLCFLINFNLYMGKGNAETDCTEIVIQRFKMCCVI